MLEICPIYGELIVCVQLALIREFRSPWIVASPFQNIHAVMYCWTIEVTEHVYFWDWRIAIRICGEDNIPSRLDLMEFGSP